MIIRSIAVALVLAPAAVEERPPNILLITADDLGNQLSCHGETRIRTPRLDALAAEGVRFENAHVTQSSCSPSRAALLKAAGYFTGIIGKLHVAPEEDFPFDWKPAGRGNPAGPTRNVRWVAEQSRAFFAQARASGKPYFYYVNYFDPHGPYTDEIDQVDGFPENPLRPQDVEPLPLKVPNPQAKRRITATIYNCILRLDAGVGMLLDVMPTVLGAAGVAPPEGLEGWPLQRLLRGESPTWREFLFTEMNFHTANFYQPQRAVRDARYKLLVNYEPRAGQAPVELFDLKEDPGETKNLADDPAAAGARRRLQEALREWQERTADPLLDPARRGRWSDAARKWKESAPRRQDGPYGDVASVPPGDLDLLK